MFCREQAARFNEKLGDFKARGVQIVAIGNGTAPMARDFVDNFKVQFDVYTDPSRLTYAAAGMHHRIGLGAKTLRGAWRALRSGHLQGRTKGDPWQQGGVLALDGDAHVLFSHVDEAAGDNAPVDTVLAAYATSAGNR